MPEPDPTVEVRTPAERPVERAAVFGTARAVARVAAAIAGEQDSARILQRIVDGCVETLGASSAYLLTHEDRGVLRLAAYRDLEPQAVERLTRVTIDDPLTCAEAARTRELQVTMDFSREGIAGALFAVPLVAHDRLQGVLGITRPAGSVTEEERETAAAIAELFALGVASASSFYGEPVPKGRSRTPDLACFARNRSRIRQSEEALRRSEARLARAQQVAHLGSWEWDLETGTTAWSDELFRILGLDPDWVEGSLDTFLAAVVPPDRARVRAALDAMITEGGPARIRIRIVRPDGSEHVVQSDGQVIVDENGHRWAVGTLQDVTGSVREEEERGRLLALAEERSWLRTIIDRAPAGILVYESADGSRVATNRRAEELYGGPVPPPRRGTLLRPDRTPLEPKEFPSSRALAGQATNGEELVLVRADGSELPVLASAAPILDDGGAVLGAIVDLEDITSLKALDRMREEWTSVVAHDLRQPVTTISAYGALLARHPDPTVRTRAGHVLAATKRLDRMIADLLDVSRLEARRLALDLHAVALPPLLREVAERTVVGRDGSRIRVEAPEDLPPVWADPARIEQALTNLLLNAVKYGFAETPIRLSARLADGFVEVAVENQGPGIAPGELSKLFQRFQRGHRASRVTGIGLGLYITRGIVEAHGGRIWAESVPGEATTFRFTVPTTLCAAPAP